MGNMKKAATATARPMYLCFAPIFSSCVKQPSGEDSKKRLSFSFPDSVKDRRQQPTEEQNSDSIIDPAASIVTRKDGKRCSVIVGTIFGSRGGGVTFCVQRDAAVPPPFLFELSVPMQSLAAEMGGGLLRIALECHRSRSGGASRSVWRASCNGRDVGDAVRRRPMERDRSVLESMRAMTTGVGALQPEDGQGGREVLYMRATYERIVGSKDAVSYHLISPGGSPPQELSVFLLRTRVH